MSTRRNLCVAAIAVTCIGISPSRAQAQLKLSFGVGPDFPTGNLSNFYNTGYNVLAALSFGAQSWPVNLRIDGMFNEMPTKGGVSGGGIQIWTANANVVYNIGAKQVITPYLIGGIGYYDSHNNLAAEGHSSNVGLNFGGGLRVSVASLSVFVEPRVHYVFTAGGHYDFLPLTFGVTL
jgi:hypothetical protein